MTMQTLLLRAAFFASALSLSNVALAADRGHYLPLAGESDMLASNQLPDNWRSGLAKGSKLDYDLYRQSKVVYRDAANGTVAVRLQNKVVRVIEDTREIVDVLHTF